MPFRFRQVCGIAGPLVAARPDRAQTGVRARKRRLDGDRFVEARLRGTQTAHVARISQQGEFRQVGLEYAGVEVVCTRRIPCFRCQQIVEHIGHGARDVGLHQQEVAPASVVAPGPDVEAVPGVDQLHRDPQAVAGSPHAALEHVARAQRPPDLACIDVPVAVREGRSARGDA